MKLATQPSPCPVTADEFEDIVLFRGVDMDIIRPMLHDCEVTRLAAEEALIVAGRPNRQLYVLLEGRLSVRLGTADSEPLAYIRRGETVGELSLIDHQPTSASVVAEEPSRLLVVDEDLLWMLSNSSHAVSSNLLYTLVTRMRNGNNLICESRSRLEQYRFHATVDALTGLFNRHWLNQMLPRQMHRAKASGEALSLAMLDVDRFKDYNDRHGHPAGDHALRIVSEVVRDSIRPGDMGVRYGGEEVLVILPGAPLPGAEIVAERLRASIAAAAINVPGGHVLPGVTASFGITEMKPDMSMADLIAASDAALYRAKHSGRNCVSM